MAKPTERKPVLRSNSLNIVLVDDDENLLDIGRAYLEMLGHQVECFDSPLVAVNYVAASIDNIDAMMTDFQMPKMNGIELIEEVRSFHLDVPIALVTGSDIDQSRIKHLERVSMHQKPIMMLGMANIIEQFLVS